MKKAAFLIPIATAVFFACTDLGGIGHEGEARISGQLVMPEGTPAAQTQVMLFPCDYDPVKNSRTVVVETTDAQGNYVFSQVPTGSYTILAINKDHTIRMLISGIHIAGKDIGIPLHFMVPIGAMKVFLPTDAASATGYVYIPGTKLFAFVNSRSDFVVIDSIPAGVVPEVAYSSTTVAVTNTIRYDVSVPSHDTAVVSNPSWKYARALGLNTSATGADVIGTVSDFPVLIRLNAGDFDFTRARSDGADLMFTKSDNTALPYEIERWDPIAGLAEVWVKVDTIFGNNSSQSIMMYWGASTGSATGSLSNGASVFDTASGFQGVWHMNEHGNADALDATANRYNGRAIQMLGTFPAAGAIGNARVFDGDSSYMVMPNTAGSKLNFPEDGYFTLSAWVYADTFDNVFRTIATKGYQQYFLQLSYFPGNDPLWQFSVFHEADNWHMSHSPATEKKWMLLTGVKQGSSQFLYCNSELVANTSAIYPQGVSRDTSNDFSIGRFLKEATYPAKFGYCYFKGGIDEVRVSSVARNADWIRLSYMNQRSDDRLVQFSK